MTITDLSPPKTVKEVRCSLGLLSWYRRFLKDFLRIATPIKALLKKKQGWEWGESQQCAFEALQEALTQAPTLAYLDSSKKFTLQTDASLHGLGAVITQGNGENKRIKVYANRILNKAEKNYSATELECLVVR